MTPPCPAGEIADYLYSPKPQPMNYLTWRQLFELREKLHMTDEQLAEPAIFTVQDGYGDQLAYPITHWTESIHPTDGTSTLYLNAGVIEMDMAAADYEHEDGDEQERPCLLRKLPLGMLRLGFSELDEDLDEAIEFLAHPNPFTPPAAPVSPGPAPLFD